MRDLNFMVKMSDQINNFQASQIPPAMSTKGIKVSRMPTAIFLASSTTSENVNILINKVVVPVCYKRSK